MAVLRWCAVLEFLELAVKVGNIVETALFRNRSNGAFGIFKRSLQAFSMRISIKNWKNVLLVLFLKYLQNAFFVMLAFSAISSKVMGSLYRSIA